MLLIKAYILLVYIFVMVNGEAVCYDTNFIAERYTSLKSSDKQIKHVRREGYCKTHCAVNSSCAAYSYNTETSTCFLSSEAKVVLSDQPVKSALVKMAFKHELAIDYENITPTPKVMTAAVTAEAITAETTTKDVTECTGSTCNGNGVCVEEVDGGTTCECTDGFTGSSCETDINYCDSTPCSNGGTCHEEDTTFSCTCSSAYTGVACGEDVDECTSFGNANVCSELNAECTNTVGGFTCDTCRRGFAPTGSDGDCSCIESESGFGTCYIYVDTRTPWAEAREDCLDAGGDLVVMSSDEVAQFDALAAARLADGRTTGFYWVGGQQATIKTNKWEWVDGSSFSPSSPLWFISEPDEFNNNKIACLTSSPETFNLLSTNFNLYDFRCEAASPYVCEVPVDTP